MGKGARQRSSSVCCAAAAATHQKKHNSFPPFSQSTQQPWTATTRSALSSATMDPAWSRCVGERTRRTRRRRSSARSKQRGGGCTHTVCLAGARLFSLFLSPSSRVSRMHAAPITPADTIPHPLPSLLSLIDVAGLAVRRPALPVMMPLARSSPASWGAPATPA